MAQHSLSLARKVVSGGVLIAVSILAGIGAVASLVYGALAQSTLARGAGSLAIEVLGKEPLQPNITPPPRVDAQYETVRFALPSGDGLLATLLSVATLLPFVVCGLTCLVIVALAILMLRGRPIGLGTAVSMFAVAVVAIVSGFARPALLAHAEEELVASLGLPTEKGASDVWFSPTPPLWDFSDWPLVVLGLLLALGGWVIVRARQLRLDLEGTL